MKIVGRLATVAGVLYLVAKSIDNTDGSNDNIGMDKLNDSSYPYCKTCAFS